MHLVCLCFDFVEVCVVVFCCICCLFVGVCFFWGVVGFFLFFGGGLKNVFGGGIFIVHEFCCCFGVFLGGLGVY